MATPRTHQGIRGIEMKAQPDQVQDTRTSPLTLSEIKRDLEEVCVLITP